MITKVNLKKQFFFTLLYSNYFGGGEVGKGKGKGQRDDAN